MAYEVIVLKTKKVPHTCELPDQGSIYSWRDDYTGYPEGTIIACTECGVYYYLVVDDDSTRGETYGTWHKVRWYHFGMKKEIAGR